MQLNEVKSNMLGLSPTQPTLVWQCFQKSGQQKAEQPQSDRQSDSKLLRAIVCAACKHPITDESQRLEVAGRHHHTFFNPAGILFEIGCFAQAPGCQNTGEPSDEFSWFPGSSWRYSFCKNCQSHLGWQFLSPVSSPFWALVQNRLSEP